MATTNLGKVSVTPKGEYDPLVTYERLDIISHNGSSYIVKQTSTGVTPIEGEFYALIAEKGDGGSFLEKSYKTYAAMELDKPNLTANISTRVSNDPDTAKNGSYTYDGTVFTRSQYDSKVVTDKIIADTAIAVQEAINNTAVEGGVLADTFLTVENTINQRQVNRGFESVDELLNIANPKDGLRVYVKSYHAGLGKGGGYFTYDSSQVAKNDGGTIINGWVRGSAESSLHVSCWGVVGDGVADDTVPLANALSSGMAVHSDDDSTHLVQRVLLSSELEFSYPSYKRIDQNTLVSFDGRGCNIVIHPMLGVSHDYPKNPPPELKQGRPCLFMLHKLNNINIKNINAKGAIFANLMEDTKPYIVGVQGTRLALNTIMSGFSLTECDNFELSNIKIREVSHGFRVVECKNPVMTDINVSVAQDSFTFTQVSNGEFTRLSHKDCRFDLSEARQATDVSKGVVVNSAGDILYTTVPDTTGGSGVKLGGGHGIVDAGGQNNNYYDCSGVRASSDCFRVQESSDGIAAKNIRTYNYNSDSAMRYALSLYGDGDDVIHYNPVITNSGYQGSHISPPESKAEALKGWQGVGDHMEWWGFNVVSRASLSAALLSRHRGMSVINPTITASKKEVNEEGYRYFDDRQPSKRGYAILHLWDDLKPDSITEVQGGVINLPDCNGVDRVLIISTITQNADTASIAFSGGLVNTHAYNEDISYLMIVGGVGLNVEFSDITLRSNGNIVLQYATTVMETNVKTSLNHCNVVSDDFSVVSNYSQPLNSSTVYLNQTKFTGRVSLKRQTTAAFPSVYAFDSNKSITLSPYDSLVTDYGDGFNLIDDVYHYSVRIRNTSEINITLPSKMQLVGVIPPVVERTTTPASSVIAIQNEYIGFSDNLTGVLFSYDAGAATHDITYRIEDAADGKVVLHLKTPSSSANGHYELKFVRV